MSTTSSKNNWLIPIAFTNIYVIWGITFLAISFGLQGFPPFILSGFRFLVAGILMLGYLSAKGEKANSLGNWKKKRYYRNSHPYRWNRACGLGRTICDGF
ncbi:EamA family transporter [Chryseobacterium proteolyticum]|uniref:EamA family transporter n=1 Tax=Chryseobacterium proteolyticum TaxID=118127 RepID=UPI003982EFB7